MSKGIAPLPTNINDFSPRILGLESSKAIILVLMVSLSAIILRYSIILAGLSVLVGIFFSVPMGDEASVAAYTGKAFRWRFSVIWAENSNHPYVESIEGFPFVMQGNRVGAVLEIIGGDYHSLRNSRKTQLQYSFASALSAVHLNISVISIPFRISQDLEPGAKDMEAAGNYAEYLSFLFSDQYYYRSFLVIWSKLDRDRNAAVARLLDEARSLQFALLATVPKCKILSLDQEVHDFLDHLK